jgi:hypothetical protein
LARPGLLLFGSKGDSLPWTTLAQLVTYMSVLGLDESQRRIRPETIAEERLNAHRAAKAMVSQRVWLNRKEEGRKPTLLEGLKNARSLECKDPRDRAYSLLAMCANVDYEHPDLLVDYSKFTTPNSAFERFKMDLAER